MRNLTPLTLLSLCLALALSPVARGTEDDTARRALEKLQAGDNGAALALLEGARRAGDASPQALAMLGALYVGADRAEDAVAVLEPLAKGAGADPAVLFNLARAYLGTGSVQRAEELLERSVAREPVSPAARLLGMRRGQQSRYGEAYRLLRPWALAHPDDREARLAAIFAALKIDRTAEAEELLIDLPPENPDVALMRARLQLQLGDPRAAIDTIKALGTTHPEIMDYSVRLLLAEALVLSRQPSLALEIMDGQPIEHAGVALLLSQARMQLGDAAGAAATLQPAVAPLLAGNAPEDPRAGSLQGVLLAAYGSYLLVAEQPLKAIPALERATRLRADSPRPWLLLADALEAAGRRGEADNARAHGQELRARMANASGGLGASGASGAPESPLSAILRRAGRHEQEGELEDALRVVRQGKESQPGEVALLLVETRLLIKLGRAEEAEVVAERALLVAPEMPDAHYHRGLVQLMKRDPEGAEKTFRQVLSLHAEHLATLNDLAILLMSQGREDEARDLLERVVALNPDDQAARQRLASIGS